MSDTLIPNILLDIVRLLDLMTSGSCLSFAPNVSMFAGSWGGRVNLWHFDKGENVTSYKSAADFYLS